MEKIRSLHRHVSTRLATTALASAVVIALCVPTHVHAAAFQLPVSNAAGFGRAFGGGSLWQNDPSASYNNPAAMAWFTSPVVQGSWIGIDISTQFHGSMTDPSGAPLPGSNPNGGDHLNNDGSAFAVLPVSDRFALGFGLDVPYALVTKYSPDARFAQFGTMTSLKSIGLNVSGSFKISDTFALGLGVIAQRTRAQLNNGLNLGGTAYASGATGGIPTPLDEVAQINVRVHNWSEGYFLGGEWKPTDDDSLGVSYHSRVGNRLTGSYFISYPNAATAADAQGLINAIPVLNAIFTGLPGFGAFPLPELNGSGSNSPASAVLNLPAFVNIDYLHRFNDRFSLGASVQWTNWSKFQTLTLSSQGVNLITLPEHYRNSYSFSLGGDYILNDQWTLRGGVAYDETPTVTDTRETRVPDNNRKVLGLGVGYQATDRLSFDAAYEHQFVSNATIKQTNQVALGGGTIDGYAKDSGDVVSLTATYKF
ncbi:long-chain fatty acid transport protein [Rhodanobacter sp. ANJX3]|uniref:outer membrane protein transport protein n=1 Tax=Rhodanobacter sp. ANJX3 TaxID=2723083 RepID=UPI0016080122|nr:outer membrane protein transport protein [Rhodanobacter sp. ANJX3]MBB5358118.1 long-chain fatty acid transport protein [Rhodanobacter sp. ANJX3]